MHFKGTFICVYSMILIYIHTHVRGHAATQKCHSRDENFLTFCFSINLSLTRIIYVCMWPRKIYTYRSASGEGCDEELYKAVLFWFKVLKASNFLTKQQSKKFLRLKNFLHEKWIFMSKFSSSLLHRQSLLLSL